MSLTMYVSEEQLFTLSVIVFCVLKLLSNLWRRLKYVYSIKTEQDCLVCSTTTVLLK